MNERSDEDLIKATVDGDPRAFESLIARYQEAVARFIWRVVPRDEDREEVCQDVFVKVYLNLYKFKGDARFSTWLYSIAYRTAVSSKRRKQLDYEEFNDDVNGGWDGAGGPGQSAEEDELRVMLQAEISRLEPEERAIITLYHVEGSSVDDIAQVVGKPSGTIKSALFRIRKKLKEQLAPRLDTSTIGNAYG